MCHSPKLDWCAWAVPRGRLSCVAAQPGAVIAVKTQEFTAAQILDLLPTLSYRSLDYWIRTGLVRPSIDLGEGSGYQRIFSAEDLELLRRIVRLHSVGVGLPVIRRSLEEHDSLEALLVELDAAMDEVRASA